MSGTAHAQDAPAEKQAAEAGNSSDIVVTAQKREERLQDVPIAVSLMNGEQMARAGVKDLQDIARSLPGISFSGSQTGRGNFAIRGVSTTTEIPTVGLYIDDIPISARLNEISGAADPEILDLQRVEVLKGPQGTLYGGSAMGGAIKFITHRPKLDRFEGTFGGGIATTRYGSPSWEVNGVANIPVVDGKVALRLAGLYRDNGGYVDRIANGEVVNFNGAQVDPATGTAIGLDAAGNPTTVDPATGYATSVPAARSISPNTVEEKDVNSARRLALRASALFQLSDTFTIVPSVYYQQNKSDDFGFFWGNLSGFQQSGNSPETSNDRMELYSITMEKEFDAFNLTSISSLLKRNQRFSEDYTFFVASLAPVFTSFLSDTIDNSKYKYFTQELRASSSGDGRLKWTGGLFYQRETTDFEFTVFTRGLSGIGIPPVDGVDDVAYDTDVTKTIDQYAIFADLTYALTDQWEISIGGRGFQIDQTIDRLAQGLLAGGTIGFEADTSESGFTPKFSTSYKITPDNMVYATVSKGFRAGGLNNGVPDNVCSADLDRLGITASPQQYDSDTLWNYEVGSKNQFADGRITVNGAAFYIDWTKIQQQLFLPTCGFSFTANVGEATSKGGELELQARVADGLTLGAAVTYTSAKITDTLPGTGATDGDRVLTTPKWTFRVDGEYRFAVAEDATFFARADYQYRSSQWRMFDRFICRVAPGAAADPGRPGCRNADEVPVANDAQIQGGYGSANAAIGIESDKWTAQLYVNNLFDSSPVLDYRNLLAVDQRSTLRPRTVGLRFEGRF